MRTTVAIEDSVLTDAKAAADARGVTLGAFVTDALRAALGGMAGEPPGVPFKAVVFGRPGNLPAEPRVIAEMLAADEQPTWLAPEAGTR